MPFGLSLSHLSLRHGLILAFVLCVSMTLGAATFVLGKADGVRRELTDPNSASSERGLLLHKLETGFHGLGQEAKSGAAFAPADLRAALPALMRGQSLFKRYAALADTDEKRLAARKAAAAADGLLDLARRGGPDRAAPTFDKRIEARIRSLAITLEEGIALLQRFEAQDRTLLTASIVQLSKGAVLLILLVSSLMGFAAALAYQRQVRVPLTQLAQSLSDAVSHGVGSIRGTDRDDDIGVIARAADDLRQSKDRDGGGKEEKQNGRPDEQAALITAFEDRFESMLQRLAETADQLEERSVHLNEDNTHVLAMSARTVEDGSRAVRKALAVTKELGERVEALRQSPLADAGAAFEQAARGFESTFEGLGDKLREELATLSAARAEAVTLARHEAHDFERLTGEARTALANLSDETRRSREALDDLKDTLAADLPASVERLIQSGDTIQAVFSGRTAQLDHAIAAMRHAERALHDASSQRGNGFERLEHGLEARLEAGFARLVAQMRDALANGAQPLNLARRGEAAEPESASGLRKIETAIAAIEKQNTALSARIETSDEALHNALDWLSECFTALSASMAAVLPGKEGPPEQIWNIHDALNEIEQETGRLLAGLRNRQEGAMAETPSVYDTLMSLTGRLKSAGLLLDEESEGGADGSSDPTAMIEDLERRAMAVARRLDGASFEPAGGEGAAEGGKAVESVRRAARRLDKLAETIASAIRAA